MGENFLIYREIIPLLPDSEWHTSKEIYDILLIYYPDLKISGLRVSIRIWEKKGYVLSRSAHCAPFRGKKTKKLYLKVKPGQNVEDLNVIHGQRRCLNCRVPFWPEHKHNFMCSVCGRLD